MFSFVISPAHLLLNTVRCTGQITKHPSCEPLSWFCHHIHAHIAQRPADQSSRPVCLQARLNCKHCGKPVVDVRVGMQYFSEYSNVQQCPHCGNLDYHFVKPFSSYKVLEAYWQMLFMHVSEVAFVSVLFLTQLRKDLISFLFLWALKQVLCFKVLPLFDFFFYVNEYDLSLGQGSRVSISV